LRIWNPELEPVTAIQRGRPHRTCVKRT